MPRKVEKLRSGWQVILLIGTERNGHRVENDIARGTRQTTAWQKTGQNRSSPAFCRWMVWGSTRTVAGNTWCYERTAEWQAVSPPPRCQSPVWLLSVCHSLTQPTHSPVPSLPDFFGSPSLRLVLYFSVSLFFNLSLFFSWLAFKLVGPVTATDVRASACENIFSIQSARRRYPPRCPTKSMPDVAPPYDVST